MQEIPMPRELLAARAAAEGLFDLLRAWFGVPSSVTIDLDAIDSAVTELSDPQLVMAMAMRKLQALHLLTTPGVRTTTDVVLTVIQDLERALMQAPAMHLKREAEGMDWDAALAALDDDPGGAGDGSEEQPPAEDAEIIAFRERHAALHEAARAVLRASEGQICVLV